MLALNEVVEIGRRKWKVGAILWLDERYYMLTPKWPRGLEEVSLMPGSAIDPNWKDDIRNAGSASDTSDK